MDKQMILELVGYFASLLVLVSLLMTSVVKLRVINTIGSLIFAIYALFIHSYPTAIMNFCLVGINIFYLLRMSKTQKIFALLPAEPGSQHFQHFFQTYAQDISLYFPAFDPQSGQSDVAFFVYCDATAVGALLGRSLSEGTLELSLDYAVPQYRDCSVGQYLYHQLAQQGYQKLVVDHPSEKHLSYLKRMGFLPEDGRYVKVL